MYTRVLLSGSAAFLAVAGVAITFLPQELLAYASAQPTRVSVLLVQVLGAMFIGSAVLNWMNRGAHVGGIYGRPLTMANFFHFPIDVTVVAVSE